MDLIELKKTDSEHFKRHPWELARVRVINQLLGKNHFNHLLDIGSGDAFLLNELQIRNKAARYTAVDTAFDNELINELKNTVHPSIIFFKNLPEQLLPPADGILLLDVIEHCPDDIAVLKSLSPLTDKNALLLITVPAYQSLFSHHDFLLKHYRRYSKKELMNACTKSGFEVQDAGYFFFSLAVARYIQLGLEKLKLRKPSHSIDHWQGSKSLTTLITTLLWFDFKIGYFFSALGINLPGLSAYCICRPLPL